MEDFGTLVQQFENAQKALYQRRETLLEEVEQIERIIGGTKTGSVKPAPMLGGFVAALREAIPQQPPGPLDLDRLADAVVAMRPMWDRHVVRGRISANMSHLVKKGEVLRNGDAYFAALRAIPLAGSGAA